jgi:hypothetical protein
MSRIFTVLAAALLVATFGMIMLAPYDMPLVQGLTAIDPALLRHIQHAVLHTLGSRAWAALATPVLARPIWLLPLALGVVCAGLAATTIVPGTAHRTRRRS